MFAIRWSVSAFHILEDLPEKTAFELLDRIDRLARFPEMGVSVNRLYPQLENCRQLTFKRTYRLIYQVQETTKEIRILSLQHCRQTLPTNADLHRSLKEISIEDDPEM